MKNKCVLKNYAIKGIVVSVLSTIMTFTTILPTTNYLTYAGEDSYSDKNDYERGEKETLGIKNLNSPNAPLRVKGTLPSIAYGNENNENLKRDTPKNYTKFTDDRVEMYETIEWGWDNEGKEAGEKEHHATLNTYIKVNGNEKPNTPPSLYRAVYIMSTCSAHGLSWQAAAASISELIKRYQHVDVITVQCAPSSGGSKTKNGIVNLMMGGMSGSIAEKIAVHYDVQDVKGISVSGKEEHELGFTLKEAAERGEWINLEPINKTNGSYTALNQGKTYKALKGIISEDGYNMAIKGQTGKLTGKPLFRKAKTSSGTHPAGTFGGDRHAQGLELAALEAYFKNELDYSHPRSVESPVYDSNGVSMVYMNVDGTGWMQDNDEVTGWYPGHGATREYNYSRYNGGYLKDVWAHLIKLRKEGRYVSLGAASPYGANGGGNTALPSAETNFKMMSEFRRNEQPNGWDRWNEYLNVIAGMCDPLLWEKQFGTSWGNPDGPNAYTKELNGFFDFSGWKSGGDTGYPTMQSRLFDHKTFTYWFAPCQTETDIEDDDRLSAQTVFQGDLFKDSNGRITRKGKEIIQSFWYTVPDKESAITRVKVSPVAPNCDYPEKIVDSYLETYKYGTMVRIYGKAKTSYKNNKVKPAVATQMSNGGYPSISWERNVRCCNECGCYHKGSLGKYDDYEYDDKGRPHKVGSHYECPLCHAHYSSRKFDRRTNTYGFYILNGKAYTIDVVETHRLIKTDRNGVFTGFKGKGLGANANNHKNAWHNTNPKTIFGFIHNFLVMPYHLAMTDIGERQHIYAKTFGEDGVWQGNERDRWKDMYVPDNVMHYSVFENAYYADQLYLDPLMNSGTDRGSGKIEFEFEDGYNKGSVYSDICPDSKNASKNIIEDIESNNGWGRDSKSAPSSLITRNDHIIFNTNFVPGKVYRFTMKIDTRNKESSTFFNPLRSIKYTIGKNNGDKEYVFKGWDNTDSSSGLPALCQDVRNHYINNYYFGKINPDTSLKEEINIGGASLPRDKDVKDHIDDVEINYALKSVDSNGNPTYTDAVTSFLKNPSQPGAHPDPRFSTLRSETNKLFDIVYSFFAQGEVGTRQKGINPDDSATIGRDLIKRGGKKNITTGKENSSSFRGWDYDGCIYYNNGTVKKDNNMLVTGAFINADSSDTYYHFLPFNKYNYCVLVTFDTNKFMATAEGDSTKERFPVHLAPENNISYSTKDKDGNTVGDIGESKHISKSGENKQGKFIQRYYSVYGTDSKTHDYLKGTMGVYFPGKYFKNEKGVVQKNNSPIDYWDIYSDERDKAYGQWKAFPCVEATGCTFLGWNSRPDGSGTWYSQEGGEKIKFDNKEYTAKALVIGEISKNSKDFQKENADGKNGTSDDYVGIWGKESGNSYLSGQEFTLYAIYQDNTETNDFAVAKIPKLDPETGVSMDDDGNITIEYEKKAWIEDNTIKRDKNGVLTMNDTNLHEAYKTYFKNGNKGYIEKQNIKAKLGKYVSKDAANLGQVVPYNYSGNKTPRNGNIYGWTNAGSPDYVRKETPAEKVVVRIRGRDRATGVYSMRSYVKSWVKEQYGKAILLMAQRTAENPSITQSNIVSKTNPKNLTGINSSNPINNINLINPDYLWKNAETGGGEISIKAKVKEYTPSSKRTKFDVATLKSDKMKEANYGSDFTNYDIGITIQGTTYIDSSTQSRMHYDAWDGNDGKILSSTDTFKHGMPAYDDSIRKVSGDYPESKSDEMDYTVVKVDYTPPKLDTETARITRGKVENAGWPYNQSNPTSLKWAEAYANSKTDDKMRTSFEVRAEDKNEIQKDAAGNNYGHFKYVGDSSGIYGVYVLVRDPDSGVTSGGKIKYTQKIYNLPIISNKPFEFTDNPDLNILSAYYGLSINLYTEFPQANRLVYQMFAIDNAGNTSVGPVSQIGKGLDPDNPDDGLTDPDPPDEPSPKKSPLKGKFENFSVKAILESDEAVEFNSLEEDETFFQAGDFGHFNVATVGYAGYYRNSTLQSQPHAKTQGGKPTAIELDFYEKTPSWAKEKYHIDWKLGEINGKPVGGELGLEAKREINDSVLPIKYNLGIGTGTITEYSTSGSKKHIVERRVGYDYDSDGTNFGGGFVVYPEKFSYYKFDSVLNEGAVIDVERNDAGKTTDPVTNLDKYVYSNQSAEYRKRLYVDGNTKKAPYAVIWTWNKNLENTTFARDRSGKSAKGEASFGWEDAGVRIRIPPYYVMRHTNGKNTDGSNKYKMELHPWGVYAYKNDKQRDVLSKYYIYDTWNNDLHYRIIHEDGSTKK